MDNGIATVKDVKDYFGALVAVTPKEMTDFWKSLDETGPYTYGDKLYASEKDFYKIEIGKILTAGGDINTTIQNLTAE